MFGFYKVFNLEFSLYMDIDEYLFLKDLKNENLNIEKKNIYIYKVSWCWILCKVIIFYNCY